MTGPGGAAAVPAQTEKRAEENAIPKAAVQAAAKWLARMYDVDESCWTDYAANARSLLAAAFPSLLAELRATEGDLWVARQVATERGEALDKAKAQRRAALDLCDGANMSDVWFAANIRAALGVCVACGCDLGTTPLCPSCEQSIEASKRERP